MENRGERPYICNKCGASFGRQGGLRRHFIMVHTNQRYNCVYPGCTHPGFKCSKVKCISGFFVLFFFFVYSSKKTSWEGKLEKSINRVGAKLQKMLAFFIVSSWITHVWFRRFTVFLGIGTFAIFIVLCFTKSSRFFDLPQISIFAGFNGTYSISTY